MTRSRESRRKKSASKQRKDCGYYTKRDGAYRVSNLFSRERDISGATISQSTTIASTQSFICDVATYAQIPYYSWIIYFSNQEYNENSPTVTKINAFIEFFENGTLISLLPSYIELGLTIDVDMCFKNSSLLQKWPTIQSDMRFNPQLTFDCIRAAFLEIMLRQSSLTHRVETSNIKILRILRLIGINVVADFKLINTTAHLELSSYGKLVSIKGIVSKIGVQKSSSASVVLACTCKREIIVTRQNGLYFVPKKCNVCGNQRFKRILDSPYQFTRVEQTIEIKDNDTAIDQTMDDGVGTVCTNMLSVKLTSKLIDRFVPGDRITVIGIPRVTLDAVKSRTPGLNPLYIDAISIFPLYKNDNLTNNIILDRDVIEKIRLEPDVLSLLVKSFCPTVQGHEIIKATLILGLLGGSFEYRETRDYIHILVIGDTGLGKSKLLRACAQIHPKGAYVRGSSIKCLEPTLINVRETNTEESWIGDGAFALASQGVCYIDELDKISSLHQSIHKCTEDQRVNTTSPEIKLDIEARTCIVGMINPTKKRYDLSKNVAENVNAKEELLSRFDMIFLMRDHQDMNGDKLMCDQTLELHTKRRRTNITKQTQYSDGSTLLDDSVARVASRTLLQRLSTRNDRSERLNEKIFQMYIHYARMNVKPEVPSGPKATIRTFCLQREFKDSITSVRFIKTLIVLSQACAKIALRAQVTEQDIYDSMEILSNARFVKTRYQTDNGPLVMSGNSNKLTTNKMNQFLNNLKDEASAFGKSHFTTDELRKIAGKENITGQSLSTLLSRLNEQGYLLKIASNTYKMVFN